MRRRCISSPLTTDRRESISRILGIAVLAFLGACSPASRASALHGTAIEPPRPAPGFTLIDQNGRQLSLRGLRGSVVALYFGFTHCKDVCPQTLASLGKARALAKLPPGAIRIVMISVDPRRDTGAAMRHFFAKLGVRAIGLSGSPQRLRQIYRAYGIFVQPSGRDVVHTDLIYAIDRQGNEREVVRSSAGIAAIAADFRTLGE